MIINYSSVLTAGVYCDTKKSICFAGGRIGRQRGTFHAAHTHTRARPPTLCLMTCWHSPSLRSPASFSRPQLKADQTVRLHLFRPMSHALSPSRELREQIITKTWKKTSRILQRAGGRGACAGSKAEMYTLLETAVVLGQKDFRLRWTHLAKSTDKLNTHSAASWRKMKCSHHKSFMVIY